MPAGTAVPAAARLAFRHGPDHRTSCVGKLRVERLGDVPKEPRSAPTAVRVAQDAALVPDRRGEGRIGRMAGGPQQLKRTGPGMMRFDAWGALKASHAMRRKAITIGQAMTATAP